MPVTKPTDSTAFETARAALLILAVALVPSSAPAAAPVDPYEVPSLLCHWSIDAGVSLDASDPSLVRRWIGAGISVCDFDADAMCGHARCDFGAQGGNPAFLEPTGIRGDFSAMITPEFLTAFQKASVAQAHTWQVVMTIDEVLKDCLGGPAGAENFKIDMVVADNRGSSGIGLCNGVAGPEARIYYNGTDVVHGGAAIPVSIGSMFLLTVTYQNSGGVSMALIETDTEISSYGPVQRYRVNDAQYVLFGTCWAGAPPQRGSAVTVHGLLLFVEALDADTRAATGAWLLGQVLGGNPPPPEPPPACRPLIEILDDTQALAAELDLLATEARCHE